MYSAVIMERLNDELVVPEHEWSEFLKANSWDMEQVMRREFPEGITSLGELQLACISSDGYLWGQFFLEEEEDDADWGQKAPWNFFPMQIEAMRWNGSFMMYCAAKVGKTRHLKAKGLERGCNNPMGGGLIGSFDTDQLVPIYEGIMDQLEGSPMLKGMLKSTRLSPHMEIKLTNGFVYKFRTAAYDGKAFRGKHPPTFGYIDEAALLHKALMWSEFLRGLGPSCVLGAASVPDGRRDTPFYRYGQIAKAQAKGEALKEDFKKDVQGRFLKLFHWKTEDMPGEFSSPERMSQLEQDYGGIDSPGYIHNVLGEDGDPEATVFPWPLFSRLIKDIPEYVCIKILVDESTGMASVHAYRVEGEETVTIRKERISMDEFNVRDVVTRHLSAAPAIAVYYMGGDLGYKKDEAEFGVTAVIGDKDRDVARVSMKGVKYPLMRKAWDAMDDIFDRGKNAMRSGVDIGGVGTVFYQELVDAYPDKHYAERCNAVQFGGKADVIDSTGEPVLDKTSGKPIRRRIKSLSTDMLVKRMQNQQDELPHDPDYVRSFPGHISWAGKDGDTIYLDKDDHIIDRRRVGVWAFHREFDVYPDIEGFGSGVPLAASGGGASSSGVFLS